jgi:methionyl-tRNA formyltransferase
VGGIGRVAFLGTGALGVPLLARLPELVSDLIVISQPDRPAGRGLALRPSPIAALARSAGLRVETPRRLRSDEARSILSGFAPDGLLLVAYGQLVPGDLLGIADRPPLNVHPSLLPRHRGAAPVVATILAGDENAGVSLMEMVERLDAGPIVAQWRLALHGREETPELEARLAMLAAENVPPLLARWATDALETTPQDERLATLVRPLTRADGWILWRRPAVEIERQVRAFQPWPGAWTTVDGRRLHIRRGGVGPGINGVPVGAVLPGDPPRVACGTGTLVLDLVQPEGRPAMPASDWQRGLGRDHVLLGAAAPN